MRKNIVAGNWKMNKTLQEGIALAKELNEALANEKPNCDVIICTPFIHLASVTPLVDAAKIGVGAENCADKASGAYTELPCCCRQRDFLHFSGQLILSCHTCLLNHERSTHRTYQCDCGESASDHTF